MPPTGSILVVDHDVAASARSGERSDRSLIAASRQRAAQALSLLYDRYGVLLITLCERLRDSTADSG